MMALKHTKIEKKLISIKLFRFFSHAQAIPSINIPALEKKLVEINLFGIR